MYEHFYGLKEKPFSLLPDPAFLYLGAGHEHALGMLEYALANRATFSVVTGLMGTGKTTLLRRLLDQLDDGVQVGLVTNTTGGYEEVLRRILFAFEVEDTSGERNVLERRFATVLRETAARGRDCLLIIDEAQHLSADDLDALWMLPDLDPGGGSTLQVILAGQQGLREKLNRPAVAHVAQRIAVDCHLGPLDADETREYIRHRIAVAGGSPGLFTDDACQTVYRYTGGVPRLVNLLCDMALVHGYGERSAVIHADLVRTVMHERHAHEMLPIFHHPSGEEDPGRSATGAPGPEEREAHTDAAPEPPAAAGADSPEAPPAPGGRRQRATPGALGESAGPRGLGRGASPSRPTTDAPAAGWRTAGGNVVALAQPEPETMSGTDTGIPDEADDGPVLHEPDVTPGPTGQTQSSPEAERRPPGRRGARTALGFILGICITAALMAGLALTRPDVVTALLPDPGASPAATTQPDPGDEAPERASSGGDPPADPDPAPYSGPPQAAADDGHTMDSRAALRRARQRLEQLRQQIRSLEYERNAARARARALEREQEATRETLEEQRRLRQDAERRAERLAAERRETADALDKARERARDAESRAARATERERQARAEAERAWRNLEALSQRRVQENRAPAPAVSQPADAEGDASTTDGPRADEPSAGSSPSPTTSPALDGSGSDAASKIEFKTDPCKGASAMFLSTCKE